jgi:CelD/BcsL family acetyltransferase involved in cellulose biosynthesis
VTVIELGAGDRSRWEAFADGREDALVYHHPAWVDALVAAQGYRPVVLGHVDTAGTLDGVLPLLRRRGLLTGRRLVSLPHTPVAGPLTAGPDVASALSAAALERARADRARLEIKTGYGSPDAGGGSSLTATPWSTTYVLRLPEDPEAVRFGNSRNHGRIKWAVGKARREGVELRAASSLADLRRWHGLYLETMRSHAIPPRPFRFFAALWAALFDRGMLRLLLAERGGVLLAGSIFLMYGSTVFYAFNGRRPEALQLRPNDLVQWHAIHDAARDGYRRYDFGEVEDDQVGLAEFKGKWGAEPEQLWRCVHPPLGVAGDQRALERARHVGRNAWRRLPLSATARVGDMVYRRL